MTQDFRVLRCCECKIFQVHQVKKSYKWNCKVCGTKQSVRQVYGKGTGADCRHHVQKLNTLRGVQTFEQDVTFSRLVSENSEDALRSTLNEPMSSKSESSAGSKGSRWSKFLQAENEHSDSVGNDLKENWHVDPPETRDPHRIFSSEVIMRSTGPDTSTLQTEKKRKFINFVSQEIAVKQSKDTMTNRDQVYEESPGIKPNGFSSASEMSKWSHCVKTSDSNKCENKSDAAQKHFTPVISKNSKWSHFVQTPYSSDSGEEDDCTRSSLNDISDIQNVKNIKPSKGSYKGFQFILEASLQSKSTDNFSTDF